MSAFLGPIHYWLFKKIQLVNQRENDLFEAAAAMCGDTAAELREQVSQTYGEALPDADLATLIDAGNIHGWLQRQINFSEAREAALIRELSDTCGDTARDLARTVWRKHGEICGRRAAADKQYSLDTAPGIYQALNDFYLNGMPCDQSDQVVLSQPQRLSWETGGWRQDGNWRQAGADASFMSELQQLWLQGFVTAANPRFQFQQTQNVAQGDARNIYGISLQD